jgi:hypothetical protein
LPCPEDYYAGAYAFELEFFVAASDDTLDTEQTEPAPRSV